MPALYVGAAATAAEAINGIVNSGGGPSGQTTSTGSTLPYNSDYLLGADAAARNWYTGSFMGGDSYPGMSSPSSSGIGMFGAQAPVNQNFLSGAQNGAGGFGSGQYVGSNPAFGYLGGMAAGGPTNPYLDATYNQAAGQVRSSLDSQFEGAGRYGSGGHQQAMGDALGNLATQLYGGQYNADQNRALQAGGLLGSIFQNERQQQLSGIGLAPSLVGGQIANAQGLLGAGQYQDQYNLAEHNAPLDYVQKYKNILATGNAGATTSQSQPYFTNPAGGYAGLGLAGLQAYNTFANSPGTNTGAGTFGGTLNSWLGTNGMGGVSDPYYLSSMNTGLTSYGGGGF